MVVLNLEYEGHSLTLEFKNSSFFTKTEIVAGKTIYQKLFEYLIDGRRVLKGLLARVIERRGLAKRVSITAIENSMRRIEVALKNSPDAKLRRMRFIRAGSGSSNPVIKRKKGNSRYTQAQRRIIDLAIEGKLEKGGCSLTELREHCLQALNAKGLGENIILAHKSLRSAIARVQEKRRRQRKPPLPELIKMRSGRPPVRRKRK